MRRFIASKRLIYKCLDYALRANRGYGVRKTKPPRVTLVCMVHYRRNRVDGATYFFTVTLVDRRSTLLVEHVDVFRAAYKHVHDAYPFKTVAAVVLPDHIHTIWALPADEADYSLRWRLIKTRFTQSLGMPSQWQRRFWEHTIRDERDLENHVAYIHFNPVKHGYVKRASDWPHSTIRHYIDNGVVAKDWACDPLHLPTIENDA